jgi:Nucleotidyltransferase domain
MKSVDLGNELEQLLAAYRQRLERRFGQRLVLFRLFGSRARGDASEDSDADVAVVVRDLGEAERDWVVNQAFEVWRGHGFAGPPLEPLVWSERQHLDRLAAERRIVLDIEREGIGR